MSFRKLLLSLAALVLGSALAALAEPKELTLLNVSYDPTRELYQDYNAAFARYWNERTGQTVTVSGWVHRRRDHGGVIFIDLRDREGLLQCVFDPDAVEAFAAADKLRSEYVVKITGRVRPRPAGTENANLSSGKIEVLGKEVELLNKAETPPFHPDDETVGEDTRLKYRYIDLRRPQMQRNLKMRHDVVKQIRTYMDANGFIDVETPIALIINWNELLRR